MLAMLHNMEELMVDMKDFQLLVRDAANAGIFSLWPFRGSNAACSNIVTMMFYFPDIVHTASLMQRLDDIFPYLELILSTDTASNVSPNNSPPLHETLTLLAEAYDLPDITEETRFGIRKLLSQWCVMRVPTDSCVGMWSSQPEPSRVDKHDIVLWVVGALKAQRRSACDCSPSAALQLVPAKTPVDPANIPQVCQQALSPRSSCLYYMLTYDTQFYFLLVYSGDQLTGCLCTGAQTPQVDLDTLVFLHCGEG